MTCNWPRCACKGTGIYCKDKPHSGPKPRKAIRKISIKTAAKKKEIDMALAITDAALYWSIWDEREHIDFETGLPINKPFSKSFFHHVLPKREDGGYPQFRHCKWNIVLVDQGTHNQTEIDMDKTPRIRIYFNHLMKLWYKGLLETADPNKHEL
jgi:hypothetical protein